MEVREAMKFQVQRSLIVPGLIIDSFPVLSLAHGEAHALCCLPNRHAPPNNLEKHPNSSLFLLVHDDCLSHELTESGNTSPLTRSLTIYTSRLQFPGHSCTL